MQDFVVAHFNLNGQYPHSERLRRKLSPVHDSGRNIPRWSLYRSLQISHKAIHRLDTGTHHLHCCLLCLPAHWVFLPMVDIGWSSAIIRTATHAKLCSLNFRSTQAQTADLKINYQVLPRTWYTNAISQAEDLLHLGNIRKSAWSALTAQEGSESVILMH